jgi:hypothetical protein
MEALLGEGGLVQPFVVATIVSAYRMLVRCREFQLRGIRSTKILRLSCRQYLESVWT